jgi:Leucine rich repeat
MKRYFRNFKTTEKSELNFHHHVDLFIFWCKFNQTFLQFFNFRKTILLIFAVVIFEVTYKIKAKEFVACEVVKTVFWALLGNITTCNMLQISINSTGAKISTYNHFVKGLDFDHNTRIFYLPENVAETFPNLVGYYIYDCAINEISRQHFKGLHKLRELNISYNFIRKIPSDTFKDLLSIELIWLGEN